MSFNLEPLFLQCSHAETIKFAALLDKQLMRGEGGYSLRIRNVNMGTCCQCEGYGFQEVEGGTGYRKQRDVVINRIY